ncbi:MAG: hypothetical protein AAFZ89_07125 [Bacteroidota bacterium]
MKKNNNSVVQQISTRSKEVLLFIIMILLKAFEPAQRKDVKSTMVPSKQKKSGHLRQLLWHLLRAVKGEVRKNRTGLKGIRIKRQKRAIKTKARIKQDFKEWYVDLKKEFGTNSEPETREVVENEPGRAQSKQGA